MKLAVALSTLTVLLVGWAVPLSGAAHSFDHSNDRSFDQPQRESRTPGTPVSLAPIRFRDDKNAGLLVNGWINGTGPYTFALDTGAGVSIITTRVVTSVGLRVTKSSRPLVGGLSTTPIESDQESHPDKISLGSIDNVAPGKPLVAIVKSLPGNIDGILDPNDLFAGMAYSIDLPNRQLLVFDAKANGLNLSRVPKDGAVVRWVRQPGSDRPFVRLNDGRLALLDTGSGLGLGVNEKTSTAGKNHTRRNVSDLGGGAVQSRNVGPTTVGIGALVLRGVPTDLLVGVPADTPTILGRRALFPFKITFDPTARLIAFEPTLKN